MLRGLFDFVRDLLVGWPIGTLLGIILIILLLALVGGAAYVVFMLADSLFLSSTEGQGRVARKEYTPPSSRTTVEYDVALETSLAKTVNEPAKWVLTVGIDNEEVPVDTNEGLFKQLSPGDILWVKYSRGRFTRSIYIKGWGRL